MIPTSVPGLDDLGPNFSQMPPKRLLALVVRTGDQRRKGGEATVTEDPDVVRGIEGERRARDLERR